MNNMTKLLILLIALVLLTVAGCGTQPKEVSNTDGKTETRIVKDDLDREVELPAHPERVLALNTSMTETLFDLGIVPVGKVNEYIVPHPEAENLPDVSFELSPNIEIISTLTPDLIIAHARHHGQLLDSLEGSGAAVFFIDPSLDDDPLIGGVALMGKVLDREAEASAYLEKVEKKAKEAVPLLALSWQVLPWEPFSRLLLPP
jgi:iron complex transport system substrate-binding protein